MDEASRARTSVAPPSATTTRGIERASLAPPAEATSLGVLPAEQARTAVLAGMLFVCSCVFVLGRTVRDALFLSHYGARVGEVLPWMFIAYGVSSAVVAVGFSRASARFARAPFVAAFAVAVSASYALAWTALRWSPPWLFPTLYVWSEIAGNLLLALFWSVANDLHDPRSAKRLFGLIGLGRIVGVVLCGLGAGSFVAAVGTDNLLLALAALSASIVAFVYWLVREHGLGTQPAAPSKKLSTGIIAPLRSPYVRSVAVLLLLGFVAVNVGDFQFKAAARLAHPSRDELALFMARYYATMGVVAMVLQLFVTRPLLRRFGVGGGLLVLPLAYGLANLVFIAAPGILGATLVKVSDNAVQFTVFEATLQLLYFPLDERERDGARATLEAAVKPLGYALAGVSVLALGAVIPAVTMRSIAAQSWFVLPVLALWFVAARTVRRRYVSTLERSLQRRTSEAREAPIDEASTRDALLRSTTDGSTRVACFAIEQLVEVSPSTAVAEVSRWLHRAEPEVRVAAVRAIEALRAEQLAPELLAVMDDEDPTVAAAAVQAYAALSGEHCVASIEARLTDPRPAVEEAAVVALLRHGALEGILVAGRTLEQWLRSEDAEARARAANVLGTPGIPGALRVVRGLLEDDDPAVRRAALRATAASGTALAAEVIRAMDDGASRAVAIESLVRMGDPIVPLLDQRLSDAQCARDVRMSVPRVLALIGTPIAYETLLGHLNERDEGVRQKVLASASRMRRGRGLPPIDASRAEQRQLVELDGLERQLAEHQRHRGWLGMILLDRWMVERLRKGFLRVLRIAELSPMGGRRVELTREAVFSHDVQRRARALEVLDDVLAPSVARRFSEALDRWIAMRAELVRAPSGPRPDGVAHYVAALWSEPEPFAKVLALDATQFRQLELSPSMIEQSLSHRDPAVRELGALVEVTMKRPGWSERVEPLARDEDESVRSYARYVLSTGRTGMSPEDDMYTTLEKVLFLQRVSLFTEVAPEDLMGLARSAEVERSPKGTVLFRQGDPGLALHLVIDGRVTTRTATGLAQTYGEGEAFGELGVLDGTVRSDDAEVTEDATILKIAREDFVEVLRENGPLAEAVIRVLVQRLRALRS